MTEGRIPKDTEKIRLYTHIHTGLKGWTIYTQTADWEVDKGAELNTGAQDK